MKRKAAQGGPTKRRRIYGPARPPWMRKQTTLPWGNQPLYGGTTEKKVSDIAVSKFNVSTTGVFALLHLPVLGTDFTARIGRKTTVKSIYIKGRVLTEPAVLADAAVALPAAQSRMILFIDNQPNALAPAVLDLLNTADPASHLNLNNRDRFKILSDKVFVTDPYLYNVTATQSYASACNQIKNLKLYKKCKIETIFNGVNGGSIADITTGAIYMFWIGNLAAGTDTDVNFYGSTRCRYEDA